MTLSAHAAAGRRYRVHQPVGRGGFGTVYRADMLGEDGFVRPVALKVLNREVAESGEVASRFRDEARVLGLLRHRAIVQVDGLVSLGDRQALVMEYIDGADLGRVMALGPVPAGPAVEVVGEVANALDVASHQPGPDGQPLGLLHRDIKPSNIRLTPAGEVKVLDFGVARAEFGNREAHTKSYLLGSDGYMAPERFEAEDGPASDIYSLGVVLLEMLTGKPFGPTSIRPAKLSGRVDAALATVEDLPPDLTDLVRAMMRFEHEERPTAAEVERRCWELRRALPAPRLRDFTRTVVTEAAAKPVDTPVDDLSGRVLAESGSGHTPVPPVAPSLPDSSEWDEEDPTVVVVAGGRSHRNLAALSPPSPAVPPAPDATPVPHRPAPPVVPSVEPESRPARAKARPRPVPPPPPPAKPSRLPWVVAAVGAAVVVMVVGFVVVQAQGIAPSEAPAVEPVAEEPGTTLPPAPVYDGPAPTDTEGAVTITGNAPAVSFVDSGGQRHREGLLAPGRYIVSADFGRGARMAGRFTLEAGEVLIVDCNANAEICSVHDE